MRKTGPLKSELKKEVQDRNILAMENQKFVSGGAKQDRLHSIKAGLSSVVILN